MRKYMMTLEQTATISRCVLFDPHGTVVAVAEKPVPIARPQPGWVELDAELMMSALVDTGRAALQTAGATSDDIEAIAIANERDCCAVWDKATGRAVHPILMGDDRRAVADPLRQDAALVQTVRKQCGLPLEPEFFAFKLRWLLDQIPHGHQRAKAGDLLVGTLESYIIWRLTDGRAHITDVSNAGRTLLFDLASHAWDASLVAHFGLTPALLPQVVLSCQIYGETNFLGRSIPISGAIGRPNATLFGQVCYDPGAARFGLDGIAPDIMLHTGLEPKASTHGLWTTITYGMMGKVKYMLETPLPVAAAKDNAWGLVLAAYQALLAASADARIAVSELKVDGDLAGRDDLLQFAADVFQVPVLRPAGKELTALGAAYLAGVAVGYWLGRTDILPNWSAARVFVPHISTTQRDRLLAPQ